MAEQWTNERCDQLAEDVTQLVDQLEQLRAQITTELPPLGHRLEQVCGQIEALVLVLQGQVVGRKGVQQGRNPQPVPIQIEARLSTLEVQMLRLTQQVQALAAANPSPTASPIVQSQQAMSSIRASLVNPIDDDDDDIEDEPDEILWDFAEPSSKHS